MDILAGHLSFAQPVEKAMTDQYKWLEGTCACYAANAEKADPYGRAGRVNYRPVAA